MSIMVYDTFFSRSNLPKDIEQPDYPGAVEVFDGQVLPATLFRQLAYITLDALVAACKPVAVYQILPNPRRIASPLQLQGDQFGIWLTGAIRARSIRVRTRFLQ